MQAFFVLIPLPMIGPVTGFFGLSTFSIWSRNRSVSIKHSTLIHLFPGQVSANFHRASQVIHDLKSCFDPFLMAGLHPEACPETFIQDYMFGTRLFPRGFDQAFFCTQRNFFHGRHFSENIPPKCTVFVLAAQGGFLNARLPKEGL